MAKRCLLLKLYPSWCNFFPSPPSSLSEQSFLKLVATNSPKLHRLVLTATALYRSSSGSTLGAISLSKELNSQRTRRQRLWQGMCPSHSKLGPFTVKVSLCLCIFLAYINSYSLRQYLAMCWQLAWVRTHSQCCFGE